MKILQTIVYLIVLIGVITAYMQGNIHEQESLFCASNFNAGYSEYNKYLYWQEDAICCRFILKNGMIAESCGNDR